MKKTIRTVLALLLPGMLFFNCVKDKGNYNYIDVEKAIIEPIPYMLLGYERELHIDPAITYTNGSTEEDYIFQWTYYSLGLTGTGGAGTTIVELVDTLARGDDARVLHIEEMLFPPSACRLTLKAIHKETGVTTTAFLDTQLARFVPTSYYILNSVETEPEENHAELTHINNKTGQVEMDVFRKVNGRQLGINPVALGVSKGLMVDQELLYILCNNSEEFGFGSVVNPATLKEMKKFSDMVILGESKRNPTFAGGNHSYAMYENAVINGRIYSRRTKKEDPGAPYVLADWDIIDDTKASDKEMDFAPYIFNSVNAQCYAYDKKTQAFVKFTNMQNLKQKDVTYNVVGGTGIFNPKNLKHEMLLGRLCGSYITLVIVDNVARYEGRAVMRNPVNGDIKLMTFLVGIDDFTPKSFYDISGYPGIKETPTMTIDPWGNYMLYSQGSDIIMCDFNNKTHKVISDLIPSDLTIDCMRTDVIYGNYEEKRNIDITITELWVTANDGSGGKNSGTLFVFSMDKEGNLEEIKRFENCCGKVVDIAGI